MSGAVKFATVLFGFVNVIVRVETPPVLIVLGLKDLVSVGAMVTGALTIKIATAAVVLLPKSVCNARRGRVWVKVPEDEAFPPTFILREPLAGIEPPVTVTKFSPELP